MLATTTIGSIADVSSCYTDVGWTSQVTPQGLPGFQRCISALPILLLVFKCFSIRASVRRFGTPIAFLFPVTGPAFRAGPHVITTGFVGWSGGAAPTKWRR